MSTSRANRSVGLGFTAGVVATIFGAAGLPDHPLTATSMFVRATAYILMVFAVTATTTLGLLVGGEGRTTRAMVVAIRTAATTVWLPPLLMFSYQKSAFVLVIWAVLIFEAAGLIAWVRGALGDHLEASPEMPAEGCTFSVLKPDFHSGISILGALMIQGSIFGAVGGHDALAGVLYLGGTTAIACRTLQMFQNLPDRNGHSWRQRVPVTLVTATFLIVFAWLPHIVVSGGSGSGGNLTGTAESVRQATSPGPSDGGDTRKGKHSQQGAPAAWAWLRALFAPGISNSPVSSVAVAKRILDSTFPPTIGATSSRLRSLQNTKIASAVVAAGPVFAGVELYPEVRPHTRLVAPPPAGPRGLGGDRSDPLSIPFDGVYWFWRGPSDRPPLNSVVMHGSPSAQFFRSTDGDGMSMEARQNLGFAVAPKRYGAIEIFIANADPFPNTVSILLKIRNTANAGKPAVSLGMEDVTAPASSIDNGTATPQMPRDFAFPAQSPSAVLTN